MAETLSPTSDATTAPSTHPEKVSFTIAFKKQTFPVEFGLDQTIGELRQEIARLTEVPAGLQKIMLKGLLKNDAESLRATGFKNGVKVMVIGSTIQDVLTTVTAEKASTEASSSSSTAEKEALSEKLPHKKVIDKGKPDDVMPGLRHGHEPLPDLPLYGILNNRGDKVRITFKLATQELWLASKSSTQKLPFQTIRSVESEPIKGSEEYHIMSLQIGSGEGSKLFLYWVPAQYTRAIRTIIMTDYGSY